jgi:hypothetical protein
MFTISRFFGMRVWVSSKDNKPCFHAVYMAWRAQYSILPVRRIKGTMTKTGGKLIREWAKEHTQELFSAWEAHRKDRPTRAIAPLNDW